LNFDSGKAITSLGLVINATGAVFVCDCCSHSQTATSITLADYYAYNYKTLSRSSEEDDLYEMQGNRAIYRNEHMATILAKKLPDVVGDVLDFGCGKSLVMKHYSVKNGKANIHLFDVTEDYVDFWQAFVPADQYACFTVPESWLGKFELVTSFFSMEHVPDPLGELKKIKKVLAPSGLLYICVPDMYSENVADMLVVDHVQHYSDVSMSFLLQKAGFQVAEMDHCSHRQAAIYIARLSDDAALQLKTNGFDGLAVSWIVNRCEDISLYWNTVKDSVKRFELEMTRRGSDRFYIVGAGILGTFLYLQLEFPEKVVGFIDSNRFKQEKGWQRLPVFEPGKTQVGDGVSVFVGFNVSQVESLAATLVPPDVPTENVWTVKLLETCNNDFSSR